MRYRNPVRGVTNGISAAIILIGVVLALTFGSFNLVIFFIALAIAIFVGSLGTLNPQRVYGGLIGAMWMIILALFFATGFWQVFILGAALSALLGALGRPLIALLLGMGIFGLASRPQQTYYQPPQQPQQPYYQPQPYQQGYQPTPQAEGYHEGSQQYPYPQQQALQYEEPQSQYPQELPPQQ